MTLVRPMFGQGRLRVSRVYYVCDVQSVDSPKIPLGVMADVKHGTAYGLGLIARTHLTEAEEQRVGLFARSALRKPFDLLSREFDKILASQDRSKAFLALCNITQSALVFERPCEDTLPVPRPVAQSDIRSGAFKAWAEDKVVARITEEYWSLMSDLEPADGWETERRVSAAA